MKAKEEEKKKEQIYKEACFKMQLDEVSALKLFSEIEDFKDVNEKKNECIQKIREIERAREAEREAEKEAKKRIRTFIVWAFIILFFLVMCSM